MYIYIYIHICIMSLIALRHAVEQLLLDARLAARGQAREAPVCIYLCIYIHTIMYISYIYIYIYTHTYTYMLYL